MVNEFMMDWETFKNQCNMSRSSGVWLILKIVWYVVFSASTAVTVYFVVLFSILDISFYPSVYILMAVAVFSGFRAFFYHRLITKSRFKTFCKFYAKEAWKERIEISEDNITITEESNTSSFDYMRIEKIVENANLVRIVYSGKVQFFLMKDKFVSGNWEDCKKLLLSKNPNIKFVQK